MNTFTSGALVTFLLISSFSVSAAEVCKVSMMGRICYEENNDDSVAAHMKTDAVAEATKKKSADESSPKKVADISK